MINFVKKTYHWVIHNIRTNQFNRRFKTINIDDMPLFNEIQIETLNRCNGKCEFCPVNATEPQRAYAKMDEALFQKIINELSELEYSGGVSFSLNNEPFLDKRIYEWIPWARERLPKARFTIWTNGSVMDAKRFSEILPSMDKVYVDQYSEKGGISSNVRDALYTAGQVEGQDYCIYKGLDLAGMGNEKISVFVRRHDDVLSSRGGYAPNKRKIRKVCRKKCIRFFNEMSIRPDGKVSLCCSDALGKMTMGDVSSERIIDVWRHSETYKDVRSKMIRYGRKSIELCKHCDFES